MGRMGSKAGEGTGQHRDCPRCKAVIDRRYLMDDALRERDRREPGYDGELTHEIVEHVALGQSCRGHVRNWHRAGGLRQHLVEQGFDDDHADEIVHWAKRDEERQQDVFRRKMARKQLELDRKIGGAA